MERTETPRPEERAEIEHRRSQRIRLALAAVAAGLLVWFALANSQEVTVDYLVTSGDSPLIIVIVVSAVLGAAVDRLVVWRRGR